MSAFLPVLPFANYENSCIITTKKEINGEIIRTQITQFFSLVSLKGKNKETRRYEKFISSSKCKGNREQRTRNKYVINFMEDEP